MRLQGKAVAEVCRVSVTSDYGVARGGVFLENRETAPVCRVSITSCASSVC